MFFKTRGREMTEKRPLILKNFVNHLLSVTSYCVLCQNDYKLVHANWPNIFVDQDQLSHPDFISSTHQRENVKFVDCWFEVSEILSLFIWKFSREGSFVFFTRKLTSKRDSVFLLRKLTREHERDNVFLNFSDRKLTSEVNN